MTTKSKSPKAESPKAESPKPITPAAPIPGNETFLSAKERMKLGQARLVEDAPRPDVVLISSGICTEEAMRATRALQQRGVILRHLHVSTLKPFDDPRLIELAAEARRGIITMENHVITGGLGSAVAERLAECGAGRRLVRIGLRDTFAHGASRAYLMKKFGLDASALVREVEKLLDARFGIEEQELLAVRIEPVHSGVKAEAL